MTSATGMIRIGIDDVPEPLRTTQDRRGDVVVVVASGEMDLSSAEPLRAELRGLLNSCRRVVLDLRQIVFIDSSGLHCLLDVDKESRDVGVEFQLVPGPPQVQRLFEVTATADSLHFVAPGDPSEPRGRR
jgi:anti-sigma B factor antagonist